MCVCVCVFVCVPVCVCVHVSLCTRACVQYVYMTGDDVCVRMYNTCTCLQTCVCVHKINSLSDSKIEKVKRFMYHLFSWFKGAVMG